MNKKKINSEEERISNIFKKNDDIYFYNEKSVNNSMKTAFEQDDKEIFRKHIKYLSKR